MITPFSVNYHDTMDETVPITVDHSTLSDRSTLLIQISSDLTIFIAAPRAAALRDAIDKALSVTPVKAVLDEVQAEREADLEALDVNDGGMEDIERKNDEPNAGYRGEVLF